MSEASEFQALMERANNGDTDAISDLIRRYEPEIRIVARARLGKQLRPYLDSIDVAQSVHRSLLAGLRRDQFDIASPEKLVGLAVVMVRRKIARHWRKLKRQQRDSHTGQDSDTRQKEPTVPDLAADATDAADQMDHLMAGVSDTDRQLVELRLEGHSTAEAARKLGLDPDVVRVRLSRLRAKLRQRLGPTPESD